ncbi:MAG: hypothetical protein WC553_02785 [Patescibacteria group bacterium]
MAKPEIDWDAVIRAMGEDAKDPIKRAAIEAGLAAGFADVEEVSRRIAGLKDITPEVLNQIT